MNDQKSGELMDIEKVEQLNLELGDYIVATVKKKLNGCSIGGLRGQLEQAFKKDIEEKGVKIVILDEGIEITKVRVKEVETTNE